MPPLPRMPCMAHIVYRLELKAIDRHDDLIAPEEGQGEGIIVSCQLVAILWLQAIYQQCTP